MAYKYTMQEGKEFGLGDGGTNNWHMPRDDWRRKKEHHKRGEWGRGVERGSSSEVEELGLCNLWADKERGLRGPYGKNFQS